MSRFALRPAHSPIAYAPSSPDPTPLRLLAFSVAEAALQPDPNSPSNNLVMGKMPPPPDVLSRQPNWPLRGAEAEEEWIEDRWTQRVDVVDRQSWAVPALRMKETRVESAVELPLSPPVSPGSYNFSLPPDCPLAESVAESPLRPRPNFNQRQLYTRSADPSPTQSTFSALDQSRPPPEFKPRLTASEFDAKAESEAASMKHSHVRAKSDVPPPMASKIGRAHAAGMRLPSLAEIQAKMQRPTRTNVRMDSDDSIEILKTPTEEYTAPRLEARIALTSILNRRPATPPSPVAASTSPAKDSRLAPFLRERTSGRLSGRPASMPPMSLSSDQLASLAALGRARSATPQPRPAVTVTPPKVERAVSNGQVPMPSRPPLPRLSSSPTARFARMTITPPPRSATIPLPSPSLRRSPRSPCGSPTSTSSPTLSIPMITCTPAPGRVIKNGLEVESDEEEGDVVLFEGEIYDSDSDSEFAAEVVVAFEKRQVEQRRNTDEKEKEKEREMRAEAMKRRLLRRRRSD